MSLDKAIQHGKERRKPYHGSKAFDPACRENTCPWCLNNKLYQQRKTDDRAEELLDDMCPECLAWNENHSLWCPYNETGTQ